MTVVLAKSALATNDFAKKQMGSRFRTMNTLSLQFEIAKTSISLRRTTSLMSVRLGSDRSIQIGAPAKCFPASSGTHPRQCFDLADHAPSFAFQIR